MKNFNEFLLKNKTRIFVPLLILLFSLISAFTLHKIDRSLNTAEPEKVDFTMEELDVYYEQIEDFLSYEGLEKLSLRDSYRKRNKIYIVLFDGYTDNIFVFNGDDKLIQYGTNVGGDLMKIEEY